MYMYILVTTKLCVYKKVHTKSGASHLYTQQGTANTFISVMLASAVSTFLCKPLLAAVREVTSLSLSFSSVLS